MTAERITHLSIPFLHLTPYLQASLHTRPDSMSDRESGREKVTKKDRKKDAALLENDEKNVWEEGWKALGRWENLTEQ